MPPGEVAERPRPLPAGIPLYSGDVDIDRFVADNRSTWDRLGELTERVNKLSGYEVRELTRLYQRTSGHLAYAQPTLPTQP